MDPWLAGLMVFLAGMLLVTEFLVQARGLAGIGGAALLSVYAISQTPGLHGWSVGLLLIGVLLLLLDGKLIQDGTLSALGLILMLVGLVLPTGDFLTGSLVAVMWILGLFSGLFSLKILPRRKLWDRLVLKQSLTSDTGYRSVNEQTLELVGRKGRAVSHLRPSGTIELDGERYSGISDGVWIEKGTPIRVVSVDGTRILVEAHNDA
ncbi:MAG: nodulation protein NfeD [Firmicutes bacterium]|uniref:NfeD-like C-terminal, partner-binding n=1 Tax=Melghirimyces thermohalophilus TaxID=1236220 RepID=A0A1G6MR80_9BACL|nr:NfeD family protein [Melghirimyces thermohalophilus]MDA8354536.1 nodulation protein NfeD [Bacillota bacterium]SDC58098.1 NfeD-like C-terminal, partner-binding [Melghirimyces thermohalophilus]